MIDNALFAVTPLRPIHPLTYLRLGQIRWVTYYGAPYGAHAAVEKPIWKRPTCSR